MRRGIGDDAAVLRLRAGTDWVLTTDLFIEEVHFLRRAQPPRAVGWKALARSLSDIAAMGARPRFALVSLAVPAHIPAEWVNGFFSGLKNLAQRYRVRVIGGDLATASQVIADVQVLGQVSTGRAVLRSGARPGQSLCVSGQLGLAAMGERIVRSTRKSKRLSAFETRALRAHLYPQPRVPLATSLLRLGVTAMMDISDGLSLDLARLCRASRVGAKLYSDAIPRLRIPQSERRKLHLDPMELALHGGEDYELLFTLPKGTKVPQSLSGIPLHTIGVIVRNREIRMVSSVKETKAKGRLLRPGGWDHFQRLQRR